MLKIFVCEDDGAFRLKLAKMIQNYLMMQDYDIKFQMDTSDPEVLLSYIRSNKTEGIYFLDIDLSSNMNGINLAATIREYDPLAKIIFVTSYTDLAYLTFLYKVEAMDYIVKGNDTLLQESVTKCIDVANQRYLDTILPTREQIRIKSGPINTKLFVDEILFFESSTVPHKVIVHLENRMLEYNGKIKEIESFSPSFYRCHQSFVVNVDNICSINKKERTILMSNGEKCLVSTRSLKKLLIAFSKGA
ncbi:histidine kinase [Enterococcus faecium UC8668]|uniref:LytR/AlgR family response regulator transcription factor n=1 Tax=Enterococcus faecium TaxID=1352 RepID=UPI00040E70DE|nr:LytTR family DNA-binding domain-containing protein [Enterococcus faecium]KEI50837.1 histidine kinase [Enterococcus faecium UC8668]